MQERIAVPQPILSRLQYERQLPIKHITTAPFEYTDNSWSVKTIADVYISVSEGSRPPDRLYTLWGFDRRQQAVVRLHRGNWTYPSDEWIAGFLSTITQESSRKSNRIKVPPCISFRLAETGTITHQFLYAPPISAIFKFSEFDSDAGDYHYTVEMKVSHAFVEEYPIGDKSSQARYNVWFYSAKPEEAQGVQFAQRPTEETILSLLKRK